MCPTYDNLYIQVAKTIEEAPIILDTIDSWNVSGIALIDFDRYLNLSDSEKENSVFQTILQGLINIANKDNLDTNIIYNVANKIREKGKDTELHFKTIENNSHKLIITYFSRSMEDECPIYFNLTEKSRNITKRLQIGKADQSQLPLWLQKVTLNKKMIKIRSSNSITAQVWLAEKPTSFEFEITDLMR